jgi:ABC-type multidrug transport system fused ATPase/permease subunit
MLWVIFLLFILIYRAQRGTITIGLCSVLLLATQTAITNVEDFIWNLGGINESLLFVEYFQKFMGLPERKTISFFKEDFNEIRLENISFKYPNSDKPALKDINMTIKNNRHIAIVGENGSGKSTLVKLLCGLYAPDCGEITINGVNICTLDLTSLRSRIAVVSQDNNLFCPTIRSNILYPNIICKEDVLKTTMHILQLDELVDRKGYDNEVGEDGKLLSGGERQRIQLANALLKNADIILLDEFTSALDVQTERIINDYIFSLKNKIVIIITHRTYMINGLDYVYCFNEGKIIEEGEPKNLLNNKNGFLHKLNMNTDY